LAHALHPDEDAMLARAALRLWSLPLAGLLALTAPALAADGGKEKKPERPPVREVLDVPYAGKNDERQSLDVFAPRDAKGRPVVLFVHGGAWVFGDKNFFGLYRSVGQFLARHGVVAVLINYRLSPLVRHPEHVKDVARAYAWVRRHARDYGGDPEQLFLCGHSAGGHLVALVATDPAYLNDPALKLTAADRAALRGVIAVCGVYRIPKPDEFSEMARDMLKAFQAAGGGRAALATGLSLLMRGGSDLNLFRLVFGDGEKVREQASPLNHVRKGMPPFLVLYAEYEMPKLAGMAVEFARALQRAGNEAEVHQMNGYDHDRILVHTERPDDPVGKMLLQFIRTHGRANAGQGAPKAERKPARSAGDGGR
jgi:acetyl esterase/lipase